MYIVLALEILATVEFYLVSADRLGLNADVGLLAAAILAAGFFDVDLVRRRRGEPGFALARQRRILIACEFFLLGTANALGGQCVPAHDAAAGTAALVLSQLFIMGLAYKRPGILRTGITPHTSRNLGVPYVVFMFMMTGVAVVGTAAYCSHSSLAGVFPLPTEFQWPGLALLFLTFGCVALGLAAERSKGSAAVWLVAAFVIACSALFEWHGQRNWYFLVLSLVSTLFLIPAWPPIRSPSDAQSAPAVDVHPV